MFCGWKRSRSLFQMTIKSWSEFARHRQSTGLAFHGGHALHHAPDGGGLLKPEDPRLGVDYSGTVEAVGKNVTEFKPGDDVFGGRGGALAEYVCGLADRAIVLKPANVTFEQAASVPIAGITALQGIAR